MISDVGVSATGTKGLGVFARHAFDEGEFIFRRRYARLVSASELDSLDRWDRIHLYELASDRFAVLAPPGCYLKHSCEPNAMRHGVKVFAWRPIAAGEEITIDCRLNAFDDDSWPCSCGTPSCTGLVVGSFFSMDANARTPTCLTPPRSSARNTSAVAASRWPPAPEPGDTQPVIRVATQRGRKS